MDVEKKLSHIFLRRTGIDIESRKHLCSVPLFGEEVSLPARELLMIYMDIENELDIAIPKEEVLNGKFNTFENIIEIVKREITKKIVERGGIVGNGGKEYL